MWALDLIAVGVLGVWIVNIETRVRRLEQETKIDQQRIVERVQARM